MKIIFAKFILIQFFTLSLNTIHAANNQVSIDPNAFYVDKDHPQANNSNNGSVNFPWETIQYGIYQLTAGQRLYVKQATTPYFEPYRASGANWGGITINVSGTINEPIIIEGYPNQKPVINQQLAMSQYLAEDGILDDPAASKVLAGFFFFNANNIILRNFEITQTSASGVMFAHDRHNDNIIVERMHIHHVYGGDNTGGIRLDQANQIIVKNNYIHDIYDIRNEVGNPYTNDIYALHSGIHGYQPGNCIIENNQIYNVSRGVFQKSADLGLLDSNLVRRNLFYNLSHSAYHLSVQGAGSAPANNAKFYENIIYNAKRGVKSSLAETSNQSVEILIYNNTFFNVDSTAELRGYIDIEFFNNIISNSSQINFATERTARTTTTNQIFYIDNNLYYNHSNKWILERYASNFMQWVNLNSWMTAYSNDNGVGLIANPDVNSIEADPLFVDIQESNFRLQQISPANSNNGIFEQTLGAYGLGSESIGVITLSDEMIFSNGFE